jgi:Pyruvate/2-oxoacid:ferredoxin oxidoreductase delta subunit
MVYRDMVLYVMSGTGNTFRLSQWIKEIAEQREVPTAVIMIDAVTSDNQPEAGSDRLFGVLFPAHGLMAPWSMIKFLLRMPRGKGAAAISGATRGGIRLGKVVIPGAVGLGNFMAALILVLKGYRIKGLFSLDMPVNMINLHWGMHPRNAEAILQRARSKVEPVVTRLLDGKRLFATRNNLWELIWGAGLLYLIPLFPVLYLLIGRIFMGKLMFSDNRCIGCGLCAKFCPNHGVVMKTVGRQRRPYWTFHCEVCLRCMGFCRQKAIEAGHSWGVILYFITAVPVLSWIAHRFNAFFPTLPAVEHYGLRLFFDFVYIFPALIISYGLFWLLIHIPAVNTFFTYTTLTRYFRRYHEPGTRLKHLKQTPKRL